MSVNNCLKCSKQLSGFRKRNKMVLCAECESYHLYQEALDMRIQSLAETNEDFSKRVFNAPDGCKRLTINLPMELHTAIKVIAAKDESTVTEIIVGLLETYLKQKEAA